MGTIEILDYLNESRYLILMKEQSSDFLDYFFNFYIGSSTDSVYTSNEIENNFE